MSFGDLRAAFDARNILTTIAEEVVNRLRPEEKIGKVYSYDKVAQTAKILFAGETVNNLVTVRFGLDKQPFVSMDALWPSQGYSAPGDIVRVSGKPGSYYISDFVSGYPKNWDGTEVGMGFIWFSNTLPSDQYLWCRGGSFFGSQYPVLASVLGDTFGTHSGDTYYLPDFSGRSPVGTGTVTPAQLGGSTFSLGQKYGTSKHALTQGQLPNIYGTMDAHSSFSHWWSPTGVFSGSGMTQQYAAPVFTSTGAQSIYRLVLNVGNNEQHENTHPILGVNIIVRAR